MRLTILRHIPLLLALVMMAAISRAAAQDAEPDRTVQRNDSTRAPSQADIENADISLTASVTARELTFETSGDSRVSFHGTMNRDTIHFSEEINLPPLIQVGRTYRDIGVRLVITSAFADIDRIVAEALGEVPVEEEVNDTNGEK